MGSRQIVLVSTAGFSVLNTGIFWRKLKQKGFFHSVVTVNTKEEISSDFCPNYAQEFGLRFPELITVISQICIMFDRAYLTIH